MERNWEWTLLSKRNTEVYTLPDTKDSVHCLRFANDVLDIP